MTTATTETTKTNGKLAHHTPKIQELAISVIRESALNPRKTFVDVEELADDVAVHGVLQPLMVRPLGQGVRTKGGGQVYFELVFGARRYRAAKLAKLPSVPCMVCELSDAEALERMIVENAHRADVHPLEEAEGYEQLVAKSGASVEDIAAKVGKSKGYVYGRMKLLALSPEARKAFYDGKLSASVALYVARIPAKLQPELLKDMAQQAWNGEPLSARSAFSLIEGRYMLRLAEAPFDKGDATLVPAAGSCKDCPKRTGNQRELFADVKNKETCTDPDCFGAKKDAHAKRQLEKAEAEGREVLEGKAAEQALSYGRNDFVKLDDECWEARPRNLKDDDDDNAPTYREVTKGQELPVTVAVDRHGKVHELVRREVLAAAVKKAGIKDTALARPAHRSGREDEKARKQAGQRKRVATLAVMGAIVAAAVKKVPGTNMWPFLAKLLINMVGHDAGMEILKRRGIDTTRASGTYSDAVESKLRKLLEGMKDDEARGLVVEIAASQGTFSFGPWSTKDLSPSLRTAASFYHVDATKIGKAAVAEAAAAKKAKKTAKRAKGRK